jgi:hypothetical protein
MPGRPSCRSSSNPQVCSEIMGMIASPERSKEGLVDAERDRRDREANPQERVALIRRVGLEPIDVAAQRHRPDGRRGRWLWTLRSSQTNQAVHRGDCHEPAPRGAQMGPAQRLVQIRRHLIPLADLQGSC